MAGFGLLWRRLFPGARLRSAVKTVGLIVRVSRLLSLALRPRPLGFPVTAVALLSESYLSLRGAPGIHRPRFAVYTVVDIRHAPAVVVTFDVLPRLAFFAENGVAIIIGKCTDAFDGVWLLVFWNGRVRDDTADGRRE